MLKNVSSIRKRRCKLDIYESNYKEGQGEIVDGELWLEKYKENPITDEFITKFGGRFQIVPSDNILFYEDLNYNAYEILESETAFWTMILQSIARGKNLFLAQRRFKEVSGRIC